MHAPGSSVGITILFLLYVSIVSTYPTTLGSNTKYRVVKTPKKCCLVGYAFNEDLECVHAEPDRLDYTTHDGVWPGSSSRHRPWLIVTMIASLRGLSCREDAADNVGSASTNSRFSRVYAPTFYASREYCVERMINGTTVLARCPTDDDGVSTGMTVTRTTTTTTTTITTVTTITTTITTTTTIAANASSTTTKEDAPYVPCHGFRMVVFWGAQTYMDANVAHVVLCFVIVVIYLSIPELGKSVYNRAVLRHNICLLSLGCILTFLGFCDLCECPMSDNVAIFLWITLQYFTNATGFWLNVICFDMTLSITRFRWMVGSGQRTNQEENRRLMLYGVFAWGGALIPAVVALVLEYYPGIPEDFPLKPNYRRYRDGPNLVVNLYFFGISLLMFFWSNVLFAFTTYKIVRIRKSTEIATQNQNKVLRKKYFLFLQLYLLMGSPWFFGSLFACLNKLVILKICRLIQPILCLLMLATHKKLRQRFTDKLRCVIKRRDTNTTSS